MIKHLKKNQWSPYTAGLLIGISFLISYIFFNKTLGSSVAFVKVTACFHYLLDKKAINNSPYYQIYLKNLGWIDWQVSLVIGIFIGAFFSKKLGSNKHTMKCIASSKRSHLLAFIGGILVMIGARFAGGCTSGHAISGGIQLAISSYLFMTAVFMFGIPAAFIAKKLFKKHYL